MFSLLRYFLGSRRDRIQERHLFSIDFAEDAEIFHLNSSSDRQVCDSYNLDDIDIDDGNLENINLNENNIDDKNLVMFFFFNLKQQVTCLSCGITSGGLIDLNKSTTANFTHNQKSKNVFIQFSKEAKKIKRSKSVRGNLSTRDLPGI